MILSWWFIILAGPVQAARLAGRAGSSRRLALDRGFGVQMRSYGWRVEIHERADLHEGDCPASLLFSQPADGRTGILLEEKFEQSLGADVSGRK